MIGNCLVMGLDWRELGWKEYQINLAAWNASQETDGSGGSGPKDFSRLKRAMDAHTVH